MAETPQFRYFKGSRQLSLDSTEDAKQYKAAKHPAGSVRSLEEVS